MERDNRASLAGAGFAAFQLGRYPLAQRYLEGAVAANPSDTRSADRLKMTEMVLGMDPFRRQLSVAQRAKIVIGAFTTAGERLKTCSAARGMALPTASQSSLTGNWAKMKPQISEGELRRNPDLVEAAMDLVFDIERQTSVTCGTPGGTDMALLLIAKLHEGN